MSFAQKLIKQTLRKNLEAAKAAEFDIDQSWYHGGYAGQIDEIDPSKFGSATGTSAAKRAFFLVDNHDTAKGFADRVKGDVHEFLYRPGNVTPTIDWNDYFPGLSLRSENGQRALATIIEDLKEQGAAGVVLKGVDDAAKAGGKSGNVLAVIDPTRLRYPTAAFKDLASRSTTAAVGAGVVSGAMLTPDKAQASADGATTAFVEPKGNFAQKLLNDYLSVEVGKGNFPTAEDRLNFGGVYQRIEAPTTPWMKEAADWYARYNKTRKERLSPAVDMVLPFSELPADLATKLSYGDDLVEGDPKKAWQELRKGNYRNSLFELTKGDVTNALLGLF